MSEDESVEQRLRSQSVLSTCFLCPQHMKEQRLEQQKKPQYTWEENDHHHHKDKSNEFVPKLPFHEKCFGDMSETVYDSDSSI